jgi:hypothetical protein
MVAFVIITAPTLVRVDPNDANDARALVEAKFAAVSRHSAAEIRFLCRRCRSDRVRLLRAAARSADVRRTYAAIFAAVPDVTAEVQELVVEGDRAAARSYCAAARRVAPSTCRSWFFTVRARHMVRDDGMFDNHGRPCRA